MEDKLHIAFSAPLREGDTEVQTYGCRQNNPDICGSNGLSDICAFVRADHICKKPSRAWKKKYNELKSQKRIAAGRVPTVSSQYGMQPCHKGFSNGFQGMF